MHRLREERLKQLLVLDEELTDTARAVYCREHLEQWVFRPAGSVRHRMFFLWVNDDRSMNGTRCRDDPNDPVEPWQWHARLPEKFLRAMLDMCPPEEVASAIAKSLTK